MDVSSYLSGLVLGLGVCTLHCTLLLVPVTTRLNSTWRGGVHTAILFNSGKTLVLTAYGGLAGALGLLVYHAINHPGVSLVAGLAMAGIGIWFLLHSGSCGCMARRGSPFILGVVDGAVPCAATSGFLLYLASQGVGVVSGLFNGLLFGLGTATGPLLLICGVVPRLWKRLAGNPKALLALRVAGAGVYLFWALLILTGGWG